MRQDGISLSTLCASRVDNRQSIQLSAALRSSRETLSLSRIEPPGNEEVMLWVVTFYVQFDIGLPLFYNLTLQINCRGKSSDPAIIEYGDGGPRYSEGPVRLVLVKLSPMIGSEVG